MRRISLCLCIIVAASHIASAGSTTFGSDYELLGSYTTNGLLTWDPTWTWNGTFQTPPSYVLQLSSTINLYTQASNPDTLFIQVQNVVSGNAGSWFGAAWTAVTMTGITLQDTALSPFVPVYSGQYANTGQYLEGTTGDCSQSQNMPLDSTPGWAFTVSAPGSFSINTVDTPNNGFTSAYGCIYGGFRIINEGVFALNFGTNLANIDWQDLNLAAIYGDDRQVIDGEPESLSEPGSLQVMLGSGMFGIAGVALRRRTAARKKNC